MTEPSADQYTFEHRREYAKVVAKAWADPEFAQLLRANPVEVLRSEGIDVPEQTRVVPTEADLSRNDQDTSYFLLPPKPTSLEAENSIESLLQAFDRMAPMATTHSCCCCGNDTLNE